MAAIGKQALTAILLTFVVSLTQAETGAPAPGLPEAPSEPQESEETLDPEEVLEEGKASEELTRQFRLGEPGLTGMIVDRTITMLGKTFYRRFTQLGSESQVLTSTTLSIHERPDARWGSQVWIAENNRIVFQATLPPRMSDIDRYAEAAVEQVEQMVIQRRILQALDSDPDLADEEI